MKPLKRSLRVGEIVFLACVFVLVIFEAGDNYWFYHWYNKWTLLMYFMSFALSIFFAQKISWLAWPLFFSALVGSVYVFIDTRHPGNSGLIDPVILDKETWLYTRIFTGYVFSACILGFLFWVYTPFSRVYVLALQAIWWLCILGTLWKHDSNPMENGSWMANPSMNGCLIACLLPFVMKKNKSWWNAGALAMSATAFYFMQATQPVIIFALVCLVMLNFRSWWLMLIPASIIGVLIYTDPEFFNHSGRFASYGYAIQWWQDNANSWFGAGLGAAQNVLHRLQSKGMLPGETRFAWMWMHSDWLEIWFSLGWLGLLGAGAFFLELCKRCFNDKTLFASMLGFGVFGMFNYPLRLPISCVSFFLLTGLILSRPKNFSFLPVEKLIHFFRR